MLATHELARLCEALGLSADARAIIQTIRSSPPARRVRSAAGNVSVRYPSRKIGVTIQAERHRGELARFPRDRHGTKPLGISDHPPPLTRVAQGQNRHRDGVSSTTEEIVLRTVERR